LLAFLGDVGGIVKSILAVGKLIISPIASILVTVFMMPKLYYYRGDGEAESITEYQELDATLKKGGKYDKTAVLENLKKTIINQLEKRLKLKTPSLF
jgi:hypothetical protein